MPLAGDHDHVPALSLGDREADRGAAVGLDAVLAAALTRARLDVGDDRERILGARVVAGQDREIGDRGGRRSHQGSLGAVAVSPATEHDDQSSRRQRARRLQHGTDAIRRVGVVHHHQEVLSGLHRLDPARHPRDGGQTLGRDLEPDPELPRDGDRHQAVRHVEVTAQPRLEHDPLDRERHALGRRGHVGRPDVRVALDPVGRRRHRRRLEQPSRPRVVGVHHGSRRMGRREQRGLRLEVGLHRGMEVEVVLREVREGRDVEPHPPDPVLRERVGRHLHRHARDAGLTHPRQQPMQVGRLGGRARQRDRFAVDAGAVRPDHARPHARRHARSTPGGRCWSSSRSCR